MASYGLLICCLTAAMLSTSTLHATIYAGLWRSGTDANYFNVGMSLNQFTDLLNQRHSQGLRCIHIRTYLSGGQRKWAAIWRSGTDANYVNVNMSLSQFVDLATTRHGQGLRIVDIETYDVNGQTRWAAIWRSGNYANYFSVDLTLGQMVDLATERHQAGLRIIDLETYEVGGQRLWAGLWRNGTDANYFSVDLSLSELVDLATTRHQQNLRLIDLETYVVSGQRRWAGVWRSGTDANYFTVGMDLEKLTALATTRHQQNLRLIGLNIYDSACADGCLNQLVMPTGSYNYGITATETHCRELPGTCPEPPSGSVVWYRWPVDIVGSSRFVRLSAVEPMDRFLTLPFSDPLVERRGIWRYSNGNWHHAGDYSRDDQDTFRVLASAPGRVIHIGWDNWSGNTIIVSHDVAGVPDAYRTIYMHLRNGPAADCEAAWNQTVPWLENQANLATDLKDYLTYLQATGCPKNAADRNPDPNYWGTESQAINLNLLGQTVQRGQPLAWAGNTGPGGKRGTGDPNTHLHIFWSRRDPIDNEWYFFDPYGIYALPDCYPAGVTDSLSTACARYPIAWQGGKPQYPPPWLFFRQLARGTIRYFDLSWDDPSLTLQRATSPQGPWSRILTETPNYRVLLGNRPAEFFRLYRP